MQEVLVLHSRIKLIGTLLYARDKNEKIDSKTPMFVIFVKSTSFEENIIHYFILVNNIKISLDVGSHIYPNLEEKSMLYHSSIPESTKFTLQKADGKFMDFYFDDHHEFNEWHLSLCQSLGEIYLNDSFEIGLTLSMGSIQSKLILQSIITCQKYTNKENEKLSVLQEIVSMKQQMQYWVSELKQNNNSSIIDEIRKYLTTHNIYSSITGLNFQY
jgi:hypothetical protein